MVDIFQDGDTGSASKAMQAFQQIQTIGATVLQAVDSLRQNTLQEFQQDLSALNGIQQRVLRLPAVDMAAQFRVSDFYDIEQPATSATVRADSQAVTLKERSSPTTSTIQSQVFTASFGSVETSNGMYSVTTSSGAPTGTFDIQFQSPVDIHLLVFDIVMTPADPTVRVQASSNKLTWVDASQVSMKGYRVNAWFPGGSYKFLKIAIGPTISDTVGGNTYTFGLTSFDVVKTEYHLDAEFLSARVPVKPAGSKVVFSAKSDPGLTYLLSFNSNPFTGVVPDQVITLPGVASISDSAATVTSGRLSWKDETDTVISVLPVDLQASSLIVLQNQTSLPVIPDLDPTATAALTIHYVSIYQGSLHLIPAPAAGDSSTYSVSYDRVPVGLQARLRVLLTSRDRSQTPMFNGESAQGFVLTYLNPDSIELTTTERVVPKVGPFLSTDYNDTMREILTDLASLADLVNGILLPLLSTLPVTSPLVLDGTGILANISSTDSFYVESGSGNPLTIATVLERMNESNKVISGQMSDLTSKVQVIQKQLATTGQNDVTKAIQGFTTSLTQVSNRLSVLELATTSTGSTAGSGESITQSSFSCDVGTLTDGQTTRTATWGLSGVTPGTPVLLGTDVLLPQGVVATVKVVANDIVLVEVTNLSGGDLTLGSTTFTATYLR